MTRGHFRCIEFITKFSGFYSLKSASTGNPNTRLLCFSRTNNVCFSQYWQVDNTCTSLTDKNLHGGVAVSCYVEVTAPCVSHNFLNSKNKKVKSSTNIQLCLLVHWSASDTFMARGTDEVFRAVHCYEKVTCGERKPKKVAMHTDYCI